MEQTIAHGGASLLHFKGRVDSDFFDKTPHSHDECEVFINLHGQMTVFVENQTYRHDAGEIRIYASNELHFAAAESSMNMEWFQITLKRSYLDDRPALKSVFFDRKKGTGNVFISEKYDELVTLCFETLKKANRKSALAENYFNCNVERILCILNEKEFNVSVAVKQNRSLKTIINLIDENFLKLNSTTELYELTHFSPSYVRFLFKRYLNTTPHRFIVIKKMNAARELLAKGASVSAACYEAGFNDYSNFITSFRKLYGVTPKKYRQTFENSPKSK